MGIAPVSLVAITKYNEVGEVLTNPYGVKILVVRNLTYDEVRETYPKTFWEGMRKAKSSGTQLHWALTQIIES